jgi:hypothetical protein
MTTVSHATVNVINGEELGDSPLVSTHMLGKRGPRSGETLLVFLDLPGASPQVCNDVIRALTDGYSRVPGGVTSAIRLAIKLANDKLLALNKGVLANQRLEGSLACAVVNDESVVLALAGPAIAYVRTNAGAFERIDAQGDAARQLLGVANQLDVSFDNVSHQPGTMFMLTGDRSFSNQNDNLVSLCMGKGDPRMVSGYLNANMKQGRLVGLVFNVLTHAKAAAMGEPEPAGAAPVRETERGTTRAEAARPTRSEPHTEPRNAAPVRKEHTRRSAPEPEPETGNAGFERAGQAISSAGGAMRSGVSQVTQSIKRSMTSFGGKMLPDTAAFENKAQRSKTMTFALVATAVLLPILIVSIVVPLYYQFSGEAERREAQQAITTLVEKAKTSTAAPDVKTNWSEVLTQVSAYEARYAEDAPRFADAKTEARKQLDSVAKITRAQASMLTQFQNPARRRIVATALGVYALNADQSSAEYMALNDQRNAISGKPTALDFSGATNGTGGLVDITWATNQDSRWRTEGALFFAPNAVYEYASATGRVSAIRFTAGTPPTGTAIVAGDLYNNQAYLLDAGSGQIWRYPLATGGFGRGTQYFRSAYEPLKQAVDLGIDGAIYVLINNGTVVKFFNRQPQNFQITGLPDPIGRTVAMAVSGNDPARGFVFLLDAQSGAVLQLDKNGAFVRQYRGAADDFVNATDMAYDGSTNTLYVTTADKLFAFKPVQ